MQGADNIAGDKDPQAPLGLESVKRELYFINNRFAGRKGGNSGVGLQFDFVLVDSKD